MKTKAEKAFDIAIDGKPGQINSYGVGDTIEGADAEWAVENGFAKKRARKKAAAEDNSGQTEQA